MLPKLERIRQTRLHLGMTQRRLATLAGVSTSLVNQIELGRSKPSYETATKIFEILNEMEGKTSRKAGEICAQNIVSVSTGDTASKAADLMRRYGFSQLPVLDNDKAVGLVSEEGIMRKMVDGNPETVGRTQLAKMMDSPPPVVDASIPAKALIPLVRFCRAVLVSEKGKVVGIITSADLLKLIE
jgi:predicted transcriptional regulator